MSAKYRIIQVLGYLALIAGCTLSLLLIRLFIVGHIGNFWMFFGDLLFVSFAAYLIYIGLRAVAFAKGQRQSKARFGWGKMLLGTCVLFSAAESHFHLLGPTRSGPIPLLPTVEYSNSVQAAAGNATEVAVYIGCVFLIVWGVFEGFRGHNPRNPAILERDLQSKS